MKYLIPFLIAQGIGWYICAKLQFPVTMEERAKELNLMHYDGKLNKYVPNDTIKLNAGELNYLIHGTTTEN